MKVHADNKLQKPIWIFFLCVEVYQKWYVTLTDIPTKEKLANVVNISIMWSKVGLQ